MIQLKCITVLFIILNSSYCLPGWFVLIRKWGDNIRVKVLTCFQGRKKSIRDEMFLKYESHCKLSFVIIKAISPGVHYALSQKKTKKD
jgi:hypothetical protein